MKYKILNREDAVKILKNSQENDVIYINQATAGRIMQLSRQRIKQYTIHPEHAAKLGVTVINNKTMLDLALVLKFKDRSKYRGKRGPQKKAKIRDNYSQSQVTV